MYDGLVDLKFVSCVTSRRDLLLWGKFGSLRGAHAIHTPGIGVHRHLLLLRTVIRLSQATGQDQGVLLPESRWNRWGRWDLADGQLGVDAIDGWGWERSWDERRRDRRNQRKVEETAKEEPGEF